MIKAMHKERGSLLILTMIIIFAMSAIGLSIAQVTIAQYGSNRQKLYVENAVGAAEAGVSATRQQLEANSGFTGWNTSNKQLLYNDAARGKADYSTEVTSNADGTKTINSTGYAYRPGDTNPYNTKRIRAIVKAGTKTITTPSVYAGSGGLYISNGAVGPDNNGNVVNVLGKVYMSNHGVIGGSSITGPSGTPTLNVANIACSQSGNYPVACPSNQQPLQLSGFSRIYANVCATNQVDQYTAPFSNEGVFSPGTLQANCTAPLASMPAFDKQGFVNGMTSTSAGSGAGCFTGSRTWVANRTYTGSISASLGCNVTVPGEVYITGNLTLDSSTLRAANGLTTPPTIVVNGRVTLNSSSIAVNNLNVGVRIISFYSNDNSCSIAPNCTALSAANAQTSVTQQAITCQFCTPDASILWSFFGQTYLGGPPAFGFGGLQGMGAIMGGSVNMSQYGFQFGQPTWMANPPGTVTIPGGYEVLDYQQLY